MEKSLLYNLFNKYIGLNGINVITLPTGSGKTFTVSEILNDKVMDNLVYKGFGSNKNCVKICIVSSSKDNLNDYESYIKGYCKIKDWSSEYYRAKSQSDTAADFFKSIRGLYNKKTGWVDYDRFRSIAGEGHSVIPNDILSEDIMRKFYMAVKSGDDSIITERYRDLRSYFRAKYVHARGNDRKNKSTKETDKFEAAYGKFLNEMFPDRLRDQKSVFLMTDKKFCANICDPTNDPETWTGYLSSQKRMIFIIDESDTDKTDMRDFFIEESAKTSVDTFSYIAEICRIILDLRGSDGRTYILNDCSEDHKSELLSVFNNVCNKASEILSTYHIGTNVRIDLGGDAQHGPVFYREGEKARSTSDNLIMHYKEDDHSVFVCSKKDPKVKKDDPNLYQFVNDAYSLTKMFNFFIDKVASYRKDIDEFAYTDRNVAIKSELEYRKDVMKDFGISKESSGFLDSCDMSKISMIKQTGSSLYDTGLMMSVLFAGSGRRRAELKTFTVSRVPEQLIAECAAADPKKNKEGHPVLLVSATADSDSIQNFNLDYLKNYKGVEYREITDSEINEIMKYLKMQELKENVKYKTSVYSVEGGKGNEDENHLHKYISSIFEKYPRTNSNGSLQGFSSLIDLALANVPEDSDMYRAYRAFDILNFYVDARHNNNNAMLIFRQNILSDDEKKFFEHIMKCVDTYYYGENVIRPEIFSVSAATVRTAGQEYEGDSTNFNKKMKEISDCYTGKKDGICHPVVVFTTYKSSMTGVNYRIDPTDNEKDELYHYNPFGRKDALKDFDAIMFSRPTYVQVTRSEKTPYETKWTEDTLRRIYEVKELREHGSINEDTEHGYIMASFSGYEETYGLAYRTDNKSFCYKLEVKRRVIQAAGRIMRNVLKSKVVTIGISGTDFAEVLSDAGMNDRCNTPVIDSISEAVTGFSRMDFSDQINEIFCNQVSKMSGRNNDLLKRLILWGRDKKLRHQDLYDLFRFSILKYGLFISEEQFNGLPKIEGNGEHLDLKNFYIKIPEDTEDAIWYKTRNDDWYSIDVSTVKRPGYVEESDKKSLITYYMKIPFIREYFEKDGFYTGRKEDAEYILSPVVYNNFYKAALSEKGWELIAGKLCIELGKLPHDDPDSKEGKYELTDFISGNASIDIKSYSLYYALGLNEDEFFNGIAEKTKKLALKKSLLILPVQDTIKDFSPERQRIIDGVTIWTVPGIYYVGKDDNVIKSKNAIDFIRSALEDGNG